MLSFDLKHLNSFWIKLDDFPPTQREGPLSKEKLAHVPSGAVVLGSSIDEMHLRPETQKLVGLLRTSRTIDLQLFDHGISLDVVMTVSIEPEEIKAPYRLWPDYKGERIVFKKKVVLSRCSLNQSLE